MPLSFGTHQDTQTLNKKKNNKPKDRAITKPKAFKAKRARCINLQANGLTAGWGGLGTPCGDAHSCKDCQNISLLNNPLWHANC